MNNSERNGSEYRPGQRFPSYGSAMLIILGYSLALIL
jgi:hypothetical protein